MCGMSHTTPCALAPQFVPKENPDKQAKALEKEAEDLKAALDEETDRNPRNPLQLLDQAAPVLQQIRVKPREIQQELLRNT